MTTELGRSLTRAQAEAFFGAWRARNPMTRGADELATWVHGRLLEASLIEAPGRAVRELAITTAGVPIVYSHKCAPGPKAARFRMLAEPGGTAVTVAEQVRLSRDLLGDLCERASWRDARRQTDDVLDELLPATTGGFDGWHGGLGFGLEVGDEGPDLRVYCNVRHGSFVSRWQRLADAVGQFADQRAEAAFRELLDRAGGSTVPVGLALAITQDAVHAIRLYCGLIDATGEAAIAVAPARFASWAPAIQHFVDSHEASFGGLDEQDITLAFDFVIRDGLLVPRVARYKVDVRCARATTVDATRVVTWATDVATTLRLDPGALAQFGSDIARVFGGCAFQYVSLGCYDGGPELTAYCIPAPIDRVVAALPA